MHFPSSLTYKLSYDHHAYFHTICTKLKKEFTRHLVKPDARITNVEGSIFLEPPAKEKGSRRRYHGPRGTTQQFAAFRAQ